MGSNRNDILTRFLTSGEMVSSPVVQTNSPSMDIQNSSNFERLLFELHDRDGDAVSRDMASFREAGRFVLNKSGCFEIQSLFEGISLNDRETIKAIEKFYDLTGELLDPHSAIGAWVAYKKRDSVSVPVVSLATAHPAKFPDTVEKATGVRPALPPRLKDLFERSESYVVLPNAATEVQKFIREKVALTA